MDEDIEVLPKERVKPKKHIITDTRPKQTFEVEKGLIRGGVSGAFGNIIYHQRACSRL